VKEHGKSHPHRESIPGLCSPYRLAGLSRPPKLELVGKIYRKKSKNFGFPLIMLNKQLKNTICGYTHVSHSSDAVRNLSLKIYKLSALKRNSVYRAHHHVNIICQQGRNSEKYMTLYFVPVKAEVKVKVKVKVKSIS
jgi:hypothetical protein